MTSTPPPLISQRRDEEHLNLLAVFHYVVAGFGAMFATIPLIHVCMGFLLISEAGGSNPNGAPPAAFGYLFIVMGLFFILAGWAAAICTFVSGRLLRKRRRRMFSFVVAAILCAFMPFGTVLGIFTIIVLSRESVHQLYQAKV